MSLLKGERALVYDRIDENKRVTRDLIILFAILSLPAAAYLSVYFWAVAMLFVGVALGFVTLSGGLVENNVEVCLVLVPTLGGLIALALPIVFYKYSAALLLRLSRVHAVDHEEYPELPRTVENLCIGAGLPVPRLYVIHSPAANAFSTGLNPRESSLIVTTRLLQLLERRELEGVLAHELVQIGNYDTRLATVLAAAVVFLRLPLTVVLGFFRFLFRIHWAVGWFMLLYLGLPILFSIPGSLALSISLIREDPAEGYALLAVWSVVFYSLIVAPVVVEFVRASIIRHRQFLADADAVLLARSAEPLAAALTKMDAVGSRGLNARVQAHTSGRSILWITSSGGIAFGPAAIHRFKSVSTVLPGWVAVFLSPCWRAREAPASNSCSENRQSRRRNRTAAVTPPPGTTPIETWRFLPNRLPTV